MIRLRSYVTLGMLTAPLVIQTGVDQLVRVVRLAAKRTLQALDIIHTGRRRTGREKPTNMDGDSVLLAEYLRFGLPEVFEQCCLHNAQFLREFAG